MGQTAETVVRALPSGGLARTRGTRVANDANEHITLTRHVPPDDLSDVVERFWIAHWDLDGRAPVEQEVLPVPNVNVVFGGQRPGVHGPVSNRFVAHLAGRGSATGIELRPGGCRGLLRHGFEPTHLVDRSHAVGDALAAAAQAKRLAEDLAAREMSDATKLEQVSRFLRAHHPGVDDDDHEVNELVDVARLDPTLTRVAGLADHAGRPVRSLDRLFRSRLGVSPKWVIRRFRIEEAATRLAKGIRIDFAALAFLLGYADPALLIHDFKSQVGRTPAQYMADVN